MTAAHFLAEAGFKVTLCEAAGELGGKAKSRRTPEGNPTEHSLRVYSSDYTTLLPVLARIPAGEGRSVLDNLMLISPVRSFHDGLIGRAKPPRPVRPIRGGRLEIVGRNLWSIVRAVPRTGLLTVGLRRRGVPIHETLDAMYLHARLLWMCASRREHELGALSYGDYLRMRERSAAFQHYFSVLPRIIVAAQKDAEAAAIGMMMNKAYFHFDHKPKSIERLDLSTVMMMDGPTSERFIEPWANHLRGLGVDIRLNCAVRSLQFHDGTVASVGFENNERLECDYALLALPFLALRRLAERSDLGQHAPHLLNAHCIRLEASSGMQFFLRDLPSPLPPQFTPGVVTAHLESAWSFVTIVQGEGFWRDVRLPPGTRYILSATWSAVDVPGPVTGKTVAQCTPDELVAECLAQTGFDGSTVITWEIDQELRFMRDEEYQRQKNQLPPHMAHEPYNGVRLLDFTPLTILLPGANRSSPQMRTEIANLFLAGEAVYSPDLTIQVPTMEKAASSGFLAARAIAKDCGPPFASRIRIPREELLPFAILRRLDNWRWSRRKNVHATS